MVKYLGELEFEYMKKLVRTAAIEERKNAESEKKQPLEKQTLMTGGVSKVLKFEKHEKNKREQQVELEAIVNDNMKHLQTHTKEVADTNNVNNNKFCTII